VPDERPVIINRDVSEANTLREARVLVDVRQIQYRRLSLRALGSDEQSRDH